MAVAPRMSEREFAAFVRSGVAGVWELHDGQVVEKPAMSPDHGTIVSRLARQLLAQLDAAEYEVRINAVGLRLPVATVLVPDLLVIPAAAIAPFIAQPGPVLLGEPMPLVVEVWSPVVGDDETETRIPVYQGRGDREIWRIDPSARTLTSWVRQPDGTYAETIYQAGAMPSLNLRRIPADRGPHFDA